MSKLSDISRRDFVKTTAYVAPLILTLKATPALACQGSPKKCCNTKTPRLEAVKERLELAKQKRKAAKEKWEQKLEAKKEKWEHKLQVAKQEGGKSWKWQSKN
jgi:hypothetical protein